MEHRKISMLIEDEATIRLCARRFGHCVGKHRLARHVIANAVALEVVKIGKPSRSNNAGS